MERMVGTWNTLEQLRITWPSIGGRGHVRSCPSKSEFVEKLV